jgi:hypothetical protein
MNSAIRDAGSAGTGSGSSRRRDDRTPQPPPVRREEANRFSDEPPRGIKCRARQTRIATSPTATWRQRTQQRIGADFELAADRISRLTRDLKADPLGVQDLVAGDSVASTGVPGRLKDSQGRARIAVGITNYLQQVTYVGQRDWNELAARHSGIRGQTFLHQVNGPITDPLGVAEKQLREQS